MQQWNHSGLEGYCKAAARLMGLPDNNSGWGNFGHDLFADNRFDDPVKASKAWTLSRFRHKGRSNRPKLFEESWLGESGEGCELEAIHTCVHHMCSSESSSALYELYLGTADSFATDFHSIVLPAIEDGFRAERFHDADIARFSQGIDRVLGNLNPALPQTFRKFAIPLVAGIIYGPNHPIAQSGTNTATLRNPDQADLDDMGEPEWNLDSIVLTQLFSDNMGLIGYSGSFSDSNLVLLGRSADPAAYRDACSAVFAEEIALRETVAFPIARAHTSTSKEHGIIARTGDNWYFYDFSTNGSLLMSGERVVPVRNRIVALEPGDRICLGLTEMPENESIAYGSATMLLVSFKADETHPD